MMMDTGLDTRQIVCADCLGVPSNPAAGACETTCVVCGQRKSDCSWVATGRAWALLVRFARGAAPERVWDAWAGKCPRCGSVFEKHLCGANLTLTAADPS